MQYSIKLAEQVSVVKNLQHLLTTINREYSYDPVETLVMDIQKDVESIITKLVTLYGSLVSEE